MQRLGVYALRGGALGRSQPIQRMLPGLSLIHSSSDASNVKSRQVNRITQDQAHEILTTQRIHRPVSPHLEIYKIEQTYLGSSAWMRITGCTLSGAAYFYFSSYLLAPFFGWHIDSAAVASAFWSLPIAVQGAIKFSLAFPLTFHFFNGLKQLMYDMVIGYSRHTIARADYIVWAAGVMGGLGITFGL